MAIKGYSAEENAAYRQKKQKEMEELFKRIDEGVRSVFTSEKYVEYLKFSAKFTDYSANNTTVTSLEFPLKADLTPTHLWSLTNSLRVLWKV